MANVGYATLQVIPSLRGMESRLQSQLNGRMGSVGQSAGRAAATTFGSSLISNSIGALDSLGGRITSVVSGALKTGAKIGLGALALGGFGAGAVAFGGLNRLLDTEDATVRLRRVGLSVEEIDNLLKGVDETFQGTPFANPDGFNIASQLLGSGVALDKVVGILGDIGDLSAHGGAPLQQVGSIFTRIASQGRVTAEELNRLSDANIPLTVLADSMGITVGQLRKMAEQGKLTSDVFFEAVGNVELFDGAAKAAGDTTRGAFANVITGMKRLAADFLAPLFGENGHAVTALKGVSDWLKTLSPAVKELGQSFTAWLIPAVSEASTWFQTSLLPALQSVAELIRQGIDWYQRHADTLAAIAKAAAPVVAAIAGVATSVHLLGVAFRALTLGHPVLALITLIATGLVYAWQNSERFREVVIGAFEAIRDAVGPIVETVSGWLSNLFGGGGAGAAASGVTAKLTGAWVKVRKVAADVWPTVQGYIGGLSDTFGKVLAVAADVWPTVQRYLAEFANYMIRTLTPLAQSIGNFYSAAFERIYAIVAWVVPRLVDFWRDHADQILAVLRPFLDQVRNAFETLVEIVTAVFNALAALFRGDWGELWTQLGNIGKATLDYIIDTVRNFGALLGQLLPLIWDGIKAGASAAWQGIQSLWDSTILPFLKSLPGLALGALGDLVGWLVDKGSDLLGGLWNGIQTVWDETILPWLQDLPSTVLTSVPSLLESLFSRGKQLLNGVMNGVRDVWNNTIKPWLASLGTTALLAVPSLLESLLSRGKQLLNGVMNGIREVWNDTIKPWLVGLPGKALEAVPSLLTTLQGRGWDLLWSFWKGFTNIWDLSIRPWFAGLPGRITDAIGDLSMTLYYIGRGLLSGLWAGMRAIWDNSIGGWLGGLGSRIISLKGPPAYDAVMLMPVGRLIMEGLRRGLVSGWGETESLLRGMTASLGSGEFEMGAHQASLNGAGRSAQPTVAAAGPSLVVNNYDRHLTPADGAAMIRMARLS